MVRGTVRLWVISGRSLALGFGALLLMAGGLAWRPLGQQAAIAVEARPYVLIDPGHGGIDGGAGAGGALEKDIALAVGLHLRTELTALGVPVQMTREADVDLGGSRTRGRHGRDLTERLRQAQSPGVRFLISLHANADGRSSSSGTLLLYAKGSDASRALASRIRERLQMAGVEHVAAPIGRTNLFLLRKSPVPAALVEMGFLTNPGDRARLQDPSYQHQLARAIAAAVHMAYNDISHSSQTQ